MLPGTLRRTNPRDLIARAARLLLPLALPAFLLLTACGAASQAARPRARELTAPAAALLSLAPASYGLTTAIALPDDAGSAAAQAAFAGMAGPNALHEPALDLVAAAVGKTYAETQEQPAQALLQWLYWKCGAVANPGPVSVLVGPPDAEPYFQEQLRSFAAVVPKARVRAAYGVARFLVAGQVVQAVALGYRAADVAPIAKSQPGGGKVPVHVALANPHEELTLYVDQGGPDVLKIPMKKLEDGSYFAEAPVPAAPGRYFLEVIGRRIPPDGAAEKGWLAGLLWVPVYNGVAEPAEPDEFIRHPPKNHQDPSVWPMQIISAYNDARAKLGRAPLQPEQAATAMAQARSVEIAGLSELPPADQGLQQRLAEAGLPARHVTGYVDGIEYVSEYITLRLLHPAARHALYSPDMTTVAVGLAPRTAAPLGFWNSTEYVFQRIAIDPPKERDRVLGLLDAAKGAPFAHDDVLSKVAQDVADGVCKGGPMPSDARAVFARATGLDPTLRNRLGVPWVGYDFGEEDAKDIAGKAKDFTHAGAGACQGTIDGRKGAVLVLLLFAGPLGAAPPGP